ncbi:BAG domain-containing protein Samui isoform X2 [Pararge aegeria]|uniref:BAG domain-containing protein Samui isoform X2 n=1 Tax=Pararge aegeria TaxID=116150 RepID=UPI0019D04262|nr:BAG domain-containing protein Samui isoform X2 [Pararge aegeria]
MPLRGRSFRGFPFDEEEGSGAWSELAARHPDIAARLRQRPSTWARKRRPSSQDGIDDTADSFGGFDRFPFDDIPQDFREHFPSHWNRRFGSRDEQFQQPTSSPPQSPHQQTTATQTEHDAGPSHQEQTLPQYGLRNTVDLGQKSATDPSVVDADERVHRSVSAPPDQRTVNPNSKMSGQNPQDHQPHSPPQPEQHSNVRHIPIFVEGRDEPVINRSRNDHATHFADPKPTYVPPPQPHIDREQYFADDGPAGFPFSKNFFRQSPQPFTKQKMYPQAYARSGSPQRSQSPKPQSYHEHPAPRPETPSRPQQKQAPPQQKQTPPHQKQPSPQQRQTTPQPATSPQAPHHEQDPPQQPAPQQQTPQNDSLKQILTIQADVLNLITEVENFKGTKNDKHYLFLDEMLTRNLIKLDNIETDGKESIRQGRKEVIKCINDCIAMLEKKADSRALTTPPPPDVDMQNTVSESPAAEKQNGDVEMKESTKENKTVQLQEEKAQLQENVTSPQVSTETEMKEDQKPEETKQDVSQTIESKEPLPSQTTEKQPEESKTIEPTEVLPQAPQEVTDKKQNSKKSGKKRDKSKDKKDVAKEEIVNKKEAKDCKDNKDNVGKTEGDENVVNKQENENKKDNVDNKEEKEPEVMQIDTTKPDSQSMEVDVTASQ